MFASSTASVAEVLQRRGVESLAYFHCDHFEPWRDVLGSVSEANAEHIRRFLDATASIDFARKLTLFYRPLLRPTMAAEPGAVFAPDTPLGFVRPSEAELAIARSSIGRIRGESAHELQLHIHHEYLTRNDKYCHLSKWGSPFFTDVDTPQMDRRRLELLLDLSLETVRRQSGEPFETWFFIHGNWALNGSDRNVCTIDDEILLLQSRGCLGDFSFPAEPPHDEANPTGYSEPSFISPFKGAKCYDAPGCDRRTAWGAKDLAADPRRFFIWASEPEAYVYAGLDYHKPWTQKLCADPGHWAQVIAERAPVSGGRLYINTYAHSMALKNVVDDVPVFPHDHGPVRSLFGVLFGAAASLDVEPEFVTAAGAYRRIVGLPAEPALQEEPAGVVS